MRKRSLGILLLSTLGLGLTSCETVDETGRSRMMLVTSIEQENGMGLEAYQQILGDEKVLSRGRDHQIVQQVGRDIAAAAERVRQKMGLQPLNFQWEFNLIESDTINAFCLPGGKVAIYTGILPIMRDAQGNLENGLAAVMGHEVAHATLRHGGERIANNMFVNAGMVAAAIGMSATDLEDSTQEGYLTVLATAGQYGVLLPYSRTHESEADISGLRYLIEAGYDPWEAPKLWERMGSLGGGERPPEWQSTHPDPLRRAAEIREAIPGLQQELGKPVTQEK